MPMPWRILVKIKNIMAVRKKATPKVDDFVKELTPQQKLLTKISINLKCKNDRQKNFIRLINDHDIVVCAGPAGTGKKIGRAHV